MAGGIQAQVYDLPGIGVAGDFASANPRFTALAGPGGFVAGPAGVSVGQFVWASQNYTGAESYQGSFDPDNTPTVVNNYGTGSVLGFVGRAQQGLNTVFLSDASMLLPVGFPVTVFSGGDFLIVNSGSAQCFPDYQCVALLATGLAQFQASGGSAPTTSLTTSSIGAGTAITGTASISGNVLTVTAVTAGTIYPGTILTGPSGVVSGTQVVSQVTGTLGGIGTYLLNYGEQTVASGSLAGTYGVLTVGAGTPVAGGILSGSGVTTGTQVWQQLTSNTWVVSPSQTAASTTITCTTGVLTKWYAQSGGLNGELVKISDHALG
jgi:hypothetical protein